MRKRIATYGKRGALVRVMQVTVRGVKKHVVLWGPRDAREQESFPGTADGKKEAIAFAEAFTEERARLSTAEKHPQPAPDTITTRALFVAFMIANAHALRPRTRELYREHWARWTAFFTESKAAGALTIDDCESFRAELQRVGLATATIQKTIGTIRVVYNYAERTGKIGKNPWHLFRFKVAKELRTKQRAEYRQEEFLAIWRQFDPTKGPQWRPYVAIGLLGIYGMRQNAVLHLKDPDDADEASGTIYFRSEWDKQGEEHRLPILPLTREILAVARAWRARDRYTGPWLLYSGHALNKGETYTISSLWLALAKAERKAKIDKVKWRAGHGFRRGLVGDLLAAGNDMDLALKAIGDSDPRMAKSYAVRRNERIDRALADRVATFTSATNVQSSTELAKISSGRASRKKRVTPTTTKE
jgi:integrase